MFACRAIYTTTYQPLSGGLKSSYRPLQRIAIPPLQLVQTTSHHCQNLMTKLPNLKRHRNHNQ